MDARVRYTKKVIQESFLTLLSKEPLEKITVKAICTSAEINRATFYKYYDNPLDLMAKMEEELINDLQARIAAENDLDLPGLLKMVLMDLKEKRDIYLVLFSNNGDVMFKKRLFNLCYGENMDVIRQLFPEMPLKQQEWIYYFVAEGCGGLINRWINAGMLESPEELIAFMTQLIATINAAGASLCIRDGASVTGSVPLY